jgi:hypothetical protein
MHMLCFCLLWGIRRKQLQKHERLETIYGNALVSASSNCVEDLQTCKDLEDDLQNMGYSVHILEKSYKQVLGLKLWFWKAGGFLCIYPFLQDGEELPGELWHGGD